MDRITPWQCNGIWSDDKQGSYTASFLPLPVEGLNKRSIVSDVRKPGSSRNYQKLGSSGDCQEERRGIKEKGRKTSLGREQEQRKLIPLQAHAGDCFRLSLEAWPSPAALGPKYCPCLLVEKRECPHDMLPEYKMSLPSQPRQAALS